MNYSVEELKARVAAIAVKAGIPEVEAKIISDVLVTTDIRGVHSHGVVRLARYIDCIRAGGIKPAAEMEILKESPSSLMVSAAGGLGIPAAKKTMDRLLQRPSTCVECQNFATLCISVPKDGADAAENRDVQQTK